MTQIRTILHVDLNSFYASVEMAQNPKLKGLPMAVAGNELKRNGVILTASYEARKYGIKAGMSNRDALMLCPNLIMVPPRMKLYKKYSNKVMNLLRQYTYKVEQFSIDEAWVDISDMLYGKHTPQSIAFEIKERIKYEIGVTVSIGISYNKIIAKLASDIADRDSIYEINEYKFKTETWKRPVKEMMGVGSKTNEKLKSMNIITIEDMAKADITLIKAILKKPGEVLWQHANGIDKSPVNYESSFPKSIGNSHTAIKDIKNMYGAKKMLLLISEQVGCRLRKYKATATVVSITVKTNDFKSYTRQRTIQGGICTTKRIYKEAINLLKENWKEDIPIRLLGISLSGIQYYEQQLSFSSLMGESEVKDEIIDKIIDETNLKYNKILITRATILDSHKIYTKPD